MGKFNNKIEAEFSPPKTWVLSRALSYQNDEMLHIRLEAVDGLDDFVEVGVCGVYILSERGSVLFELESSGSNYS